MHIYPINVQHYFSLFSCSFRVSSNFNLIFSPSLSIRYKLFYIFIWFTFTFTLTLHHTIW